jgi:hypothetical protein
VKSTWGNDFYIINTTQLTPADSNGYRWPEWYARCVVQKFYKPNPSRRSR